MNYRSSFLSSIPPVTKNLLIINTLFLLGTLAAQNMYGINLSQYLGLHYPLSDFFHPVQLVTYMFMHGGISHLFFNMFALYMFGRILESVWGPKRFLTFYLVTGIGAGLVNILFSYIDYYSVTSQMTTQQIELVFAQGSEAWRNGQNFTNPVMARLNGILNIPTVGASGAVFGILLGFGMLFPDTELMLLFPPIPIKAKYFVVMYGVMELFMGVANFSYDNVAHWAHLGGMVFGFFMIRYWKRKGIC